MILDLWFAIVGLPLLIFFMGVVTYWAARMGDCD